jgi:putative ABC transport system ATP-binding protein
MEILQGLNAERGLSIVLVTHEQDIAQYAKRNIVFRDGKINKDHMVTNRLNAAEVLRTMPTIED